MQASGRSVVGRILGRRDGLQQAQDRRARRGDRRPRAARRRCSSFDWYEISGFGGLIEQFGEAVGVDTGDQGLGRPGLPRHDREPRDPGCRASRRSALAFADGHVAHRRAAGRGQRDHRRPRHRRRGDGAAAHGVPARPERGRRPPLRHPARADRRAASSPTAAGRACRRRARRSTTRATSCARRWRRPTRRHRRRSSRSAPPRDRAAARAERHARRGDLAPAASQPRRRRAFIASGPWFV